MLRLKRLLLFSAAQTHSGEQVRHRHVQTRGFHARETPRKVKYQFSDSNKKIAFLVVDLTEEMRKVDDVRRNVDFTMF